MVSAMIPSLGFNGHPPLGVNATIAEVLREIEKIHVSMGTHPWG